MPVPTLSILIPALGSRPWQLIYNSLMSQVASNAPGRVEVLVELDDGERPSGYKRQRLLERATGDYIAFVDDDDKLAPNYISSILEAYNFEPDVVTFNMKVTHVIPRYDKARPLPSKETWKLGLHNDARKYGLMAANHLCAWRASIAKRVAWCPALGYGDDQLWYQIIHAMGLATTEVHIDQPLYEYVYNKFHSVNQKKDIKEFSTRYVGNGLRCFYDHDKEIFVELGACSTPTDDLVVVRDRHNIVHTRPLDSLNHFYTVRLI